MSTVAKKVIMGSGAVDAYEIDQSLIFEGDGSAGGSGGKLSKLPSSSGNLKTWTYSTWVKIPNPASGGIGNYLYGYSLYPSGWSQSSIMITGTGALQVVSDMYASFSLKTNRLLRDSSAWYHIVAAIDTTQSTAANRLKLYVNGVQETSFAISTYPGLNAESAINRSGHIQNIGYTNSYYVRQQLAETHFINGSQLTPSSFGETNEDTGQWIPKKYSGSYGTNGFYLKFASGAIGTDSSGEGNNYTATNLANADVVTDTPTNNFATLLPFAGFGTYSSATTTTTAITTSEGNLVGTGASGINGSGSMAVSSGKWYWEVMVIGSSGYGHAGIYGYGSGRISDSLRVDNGNKYRFMLNADDGEWQYATNGGSFSSAAAITGDGGNAVNGPWAASLTCFGTGSKLHFNFGQNGTFNGAATAGGNADSGGVGDFFYAPPSGYLALCTANLPDPATPLPSAHFNTVLWAGDGQTNRAITGVGHASDFVWVKARTSTEWHNLYDKIRGVGKQVWSNSTSAETTYDSGEGLKVFGADGFTVGNSEIINQASQNFVGWSWKANGAGSTDTSGDIDAVVSANQTSGFSIVTWTATGSNTATVPHGLGVTPEIIFYKSRSASGNWNTWTTAIDGSNDSLLLNTTGAKSDNSGIYGNLTSSVFPNWGLGNGTTQVAYCFASKPGFSKIGVYTGNGSGTEGPFVNLGFKPAWVMIKGTSAANEWYLYDAARSPANEINYYLEADTADAEAGMDKFDFLSNGFKIRNGYGGSNTNNGVYLYLAFAESPFKYATAR